MSRLVHWIKQVLVAVERTSFVDVCSAIIALAFEFWLRGLPFRTDFSLTASIDVIGAFLSFTFVANALVRFRGTRDRMALVLAVGFGTSGLLELGASVELFRNFAA